MNVKREPTDEKKKKKQREKGGKRYKGKMEESKRKWKKKEFRRQTSLGRCWCERNETPGVSFSRTVKSSQEKRDVV